MAAIVITIKRAYQLRRELRDGRSKTGPTLDCLFGRCLDLPENACRDGSESVSETLRKRTFDDDVPNRQTLAVVSHVSQAQHLPAGGYLGPRRRSWCRVTRCSRRVAPDGGWLGSVRVHENAAPIVAFVARTSETVRGRCAWARVRNSREVSAGARKYCTARARVTGLTSKNSKRVVRTYARK